MEISAKTLTPEDEVLSRNIDDYPDGIIIPIDKPYRWTSADVIRKVKYAAIRHFGKKNLKVGHAGTLDPLATGVLLVCIGKATKLAEELQSHDKEYVAGVTFGATTPSYDLEKEIDRFFPHEHISAEAVSEALPGFLGEQDQVAPLFSAKSVDGVRAYELARKLYKTNSGSDSGDPHPVEAGKSSELDSAAEQLLRVSRIHITELELLSFAGRNEGLMDRATRGTEDGIVSDKTNSPADFCNEQSAAAGMGEVSEANIHEPSSCQHATTASSRINVTDNSALGLPRAVIRMACSKGTYVRAFARDLGEALGSGAHLDSLQRSRSGIFCVGNALTVEQALQKLQGVFHN